MLLIASRNSTISQLINNLPQRFTWSDRVKNFPSDSSQQIIKNAISSPNNFFNSLGYESLSCSAIDETDGARFTLNNGDIIHLRPSGNAPDSVVMLRPVMKIRLSNMLRMCWEILPL